jgi:hypothetical protein
MYKLFLMLPFLGVAVVAKDSPQDVVWWAGMIISVLAAVVAYINKPKQ